jgi:hypothetical protein
MSILDTERKIMAICQPMTGDRATGKVVVKAAGVDPVELPLGTVLFPILSQVRYDLPFKVAASAPLSSTEDGAWTIAGGGAETVVDIFSNIGGERHNLPNPERDSSSTRQ